MSRSYVTRGKGVLLVNYAGYVLTGNTFIPDSSLATLAGALLAEGIPAEIVDLQNPHDIGSIMDGADPAPASAALEDLARHGELAPDRFEAYRRGRDAGQRRLEARVIRRLLDRIAQGDVGLLGFKLWPGNGLRGAVRMAEAVREAFPDLPIVAGGPAVSYGRELLLQYAPVIDAAVYGDGEEALALLARGRWEEAPGVIRREGDRLVTSPARPPRRLDHIPAPVYSPDVYPDAERMFRMRILDDSRGCFNKCAFCSHTHLSGITRAKSPRRVVDEMESAVREGVRDFRLSGSNPPRKFLEGVAREIIARGLDVRYGVYSSMNNARPGMMPLLAESGCRGLFFGIESGDPDLLARVHHKNNLGHDHVVAVAEAAMAEGIFTCASVIVPAPFETEKTKRATLELVRAMFARHRHGSVMVLPAFLTPGSQWWAQPEDFGFALDRGLDRTRLALQLLEWDVNFLLPRGLANDLGYSMNGKHPAELFEESEGFAGAVEESGVPTNMDDASFMIGRLGGLDVRTYKERILSSLVLGGSARLTGLVDDINGTSVTPAPADRPAAALAE